MVLAQLTSLQRGNVSAAARFHVFAGIPNGTDMSERAMATMLQDDRFLMILGHDEVTTYRHSTINIELGRNIHIGEVARRTNDLCLVCQWRSMVAFLAVILERWQRRFC